MSKFMDETSALIPDDLTSEQEFRFIEVYNGAISTRRSEAEALALAGASLVTPEDRMPVEIEERGGPGSGHFGHLGRLGQVGGSEPSGSERGVPTDAETFHRAFKEAFRGNKYTHFVTHHPVEELEDMVVLLTAHDGKVGVAVKDHGNGDIEATALFNSGGPDRAGMRMLAQVIVEYGVNYLEAYDGKLTKLYKAVGFKEFERSEFNPEYAPDWDYGYDRPDYVSMRLP